MKAAKLIILVMILTLINMPAFAERRLQAAADDRMREEGQFAPDQEPDGRPSEERREEIRKKIETIRIWRMTEALKLDVGTAAKLSAVLSPIEQKRRYTMHEQFDIMKTMRQALKLQKPDEATIQELLNKLENNHRSIQELRNEETKAVKNILTIEQQARFLIFQREFQREIREMIADARGRAEGPGEGRSDRGSFRGSDGPAPGRGGAGRPPQY